MYPAQSFPCCLLSHLLLHFLIARLRSSLSPDDNSRKQEAEWKEKAKVELEEWHARQNEQLEKTKTNNRYWLHRVVETGQGRTGMRVG